MTETGEAAAAEKKEETKKTPPAKVGKSGSSPGKKVDTSKAVAGMKKNTGKKTTPAKKAAPAKKSTAKKATPAKKKAEPKKKEAPGVVGVLKRFSKGKTVEDMAGILETTPAKVRGQIDAARRQGHNIKRIARNTFQLIKAEQPAEKPAAEKKEE